MTPDNFKSIEIPNHPFVGPCQKTPSQWIPWVKKGHPSKITMKTCSPLFSPGLRPFTKNREDSRCSPQAPFGEFFGEESWIFGEESWMKSESVGLKFHPGKTGASSAFLPAECIIYEGIISC